MSNAVATHQDHYVQSAEWYDILAEQHWRGRYASVRHALHSACPQAKRVLDIGSGTGLVLTTLADMYPQAEIHAVEPAASMRIGLMARILADTHLRQHVTVHPVGIEQATLPADIDVVLLCGCVGFFDDATRRALWSRLAASLTVGGIVLVDVMPLDRPQSVPESQVANVEVGLHHYVIWLGGHPVENNPEMMRWHMRFEQHEEDRLIRHFAINRDWRAFGLQKIVDEAGEVGFKAEPLADSPVPATLLRLQS